MTQDKCVYTVRVTSTDAVQAVRHHVEWSSDEEFSAEITKEIVDETASVLSDSILFEIEVHGDAYEIPVFEEGFAEISEAEVVTGNVDIGKSKLA